MFTDAEYQEIAIMAIYNYYNGEYTKEYIQSNFTLAIKVFIDNAKNSIKPIGVKSIAENGASITYKDEYERFSVTSDELHSCLRKLILKCGRWIIWY